MIVGWIGRVGNQIVNGNAEVGSRSVIKFRQVVAIADGAIEQFRHQFFTVAGGAENQTVIDAGELRKQLAA